MVEIDNTPNTFYIIQANLFYCLLSNKLNGSKTSKAHNKHIFQKLSNVSRLKLVYPFRQLCFFSLSLSPSSLIHAHMLTLSLISPQTSPRHCFSYHNFSVCFYFLVLNLCNTFICTYLVRRLAVKKHNIGLFCYPCK